MKFFKKIYRNYVCVKLSDYKGFESELQINKLLFFVFLGLAVACLIINAHNNSVSVLLKKLTRIGAFGEEKSKKLSDLGLGSSRAIKRVLTSKSGVVKHLIAQKGVVPLSYEEYTELERSKKRLRGLKRSEKNQKITEIEKKLSGEINFETAEFYIPENMKEASERFISEKSTTLAKGFVYAFLVLAFYVGVMFFMPTLLDWISKLVM